MGFGAGEGTVAFIDGVGYSSNNPFYTCPANTYAKIQILGWNGGNDYLWFGYAPGIYTTSQVWGKNIDFGTPSTTQYSFDGPFYVNTEETSGNTPRILPEITIMAGEKIFRTQTTLSNAYYLFMNIIEYAIP